MLSKRDLANLPSACIAAGCKNRSNMKGIHLHRLPLRSPALLKLWLAKLKLKNPPVNAYAKICSAHFHPDCYLRDLRNELTYAKPKFWLKKDAIPAIFDFSHCSHSSVLFVLFILLTRGKTSDDKHRTIAQTHFRRYRQYHVRLFFLFGFLIFSPVNAVVKQTPVLSVHTTQRAC